MVEHLPSGSTFNLQHHRKESAPSLGDRSGLDSLISVPLLSVRGNTYPSCAWHSYTVYTTLLSEMCSLWHIMNTHYFSVALGNWTLILSVS